MLGSNDADYCWELHCCTGFWTSFPSCERYIFWCIYMGFNFFSLGSFECVVHLIFVHWELKAHPNNVPPAVLHGLFLSPSIYVLQIRWPWLRYAIFVQHFRHHKVNEHKNKNRKENQGAKIVHWLCVQELDWNSTYNVYFLLLL